MQIHDESIIRELLLKRLAPKDLLVAVLERISDSSVTWESKRGLWHFLYNTSRDQILVRALQEAVVRKERIPFDVLIRLHNKVHFTPDKAVIASLLIGLVKQKAEEEVLVATGFDKWAPQLIKIRADFMAQKQAEQKEFKAGLWEKFEFLKNQRMTVQARRVLNRLVQLYPEDQELRTTKQNFDEQHAREVIANHVATLQAGARERTQTSTGPADEEMLKNFLREGEILAVDHREFALDMAVAFWFLEDYYRSLEILAWAPPSVAADWMRADVLFAARRFIEALEQLNQLEAKYIEDPETTFSANYLRAQCMHGLGQPTQALEIMQSIVRARPQYRSAHAFILEWSAGASWG